MKEIERIERAAIALNEAARPIAILSHISWPTSVRDRFLESKGRELPTGISYPEFADQELQRYLEEAKPLISGVTNPIVREYLERCYFAVAKSSELLGACGKPSFFQVSKELYGTPKGIAVDGVPSALSLAKKITSLLDLYTGQDLGEPAEACFLPAHVQERMQNVVKIFGVDAPTIEISEELSANATATSERVRIRSSACFSDLDIRQLIEHEIMIHVATSINGRSQSKVPILFQSHPGTTKTQEGLAVFSELITGVLDLDRLQRLADRVIGIQMAIDGADFIEIFDFYRDRTSTETQAYESTRRIFRGGLVSGAAPFTKDVVYLEGLLRVHNFLRMLVSKGKGSHLPMLFAGKMDIEDLPAIAELTNMGLCFPPRFLPSWVRDRRFLVTYLGYSSFLNGVDLQRVRSHYEELTSSL